MAIKLTQAEVDEVRQRAMIQTMVTHVTKLRDPHIPAYHLRFPYPHTRTYERREGNPPGDKVDKETRAGGKPHGDKRFPWEIGLRLELPIRYVKPDVALHILRLEKERVSMQSADGPWDMQQVKEHFWKIVRDEEIPMAVPDVPATILTPADIAAQEQQQRADVIDFMRRKAEIAVRRTKH